MATRIRYSAVPFKERKNENTSPDDGKKSNILSVGNPELAKEWHLTMNGELTPDMVTAWSNKKIWWRCKQGHEWQASISNRNKGRGCPYCANKKVLQGFNDLTTVNPVLAAEWHPTKNGILTPDAVTARSSKKAWWRGKCGHEWQARISHRNNGVSCPYCSGRAAIKGINDLATLNPKLASEWNIIKNGNLSPDGFTVNSGKKVWWRCNQGHEWSATIASRNKGTGCPKCMKESQTSFSEQAVYFYIKKRYIDAINRDISFGKEFDVYIPSLRTAIEYDGQQFHTDLSKDKQKSEWCKEQGIRLIRIREKGCPKLNDDDIIIRNSKSSISLNIAISMLMEMLNIKNCDIDVERDNAKILKQYIKGKKRNSFASVFPELVCEWDSEKNINMSPDMFAPFSNKKVWWKCKYGHTWMATIGERSDGNGCPFCSGHRTWKGFNDLLSKNPKVASEWHPYKNGNLMPDMVTEYSGKKVWWRCKQGHEWQTRISHRSNGVGCPYCAGQMAVKGVNDLLTKNPGLAAEWHPSKNGGLTPDMVMTGSSKKVWWLCKQGHEWQAIIYERSKGRDCPSCVEQRKIKPLS